MRVKPKITALLAAAILLTTLVPCTTFATSISGDSTVNNVTISAVVPTNLAFALDPLELNSISNNQVSRAAYTVINKTKAPIKVDFDLTAALGSGVTLVDDKTVLAKDDFRIDPNDKKLYFASLGAYDTTLNTAAFDNGGATDPSVTPAYDVTKNTVTPFNASDGKSAFSFVLDKANLTAGGDTLTDTSDDVGTIAKTNVASFQFYAQLNTYATWAPNDIKVQGTYTLTALRSSAYTGLTAGDFLTDGLNQIPKYTSPGFIVNGAIKTSVDVEIDMTMALSDESIPFYSADDSLAGATLAIVPGYYATADDFELTNSSLVLKMTAPSIFKTGTPDTYNMILTVDGKAYTVNLTLTAS